MEDELITEDKRQQVIALVLEAQHLNAAMQNKHATGSNRWHEHETLDDKLHDALTLLGD